MKNKLVHRFIIGTFVSLYLLVSVISTIHVIEFFKLSNPYWLAVSLAIAFELGAAASLASLIILDKMNKTLVWMLFGTITLMQMQGNMYYAFVHMENFQGWSELFGLIEEDIIYQKRVLSAVSGAILPLVALGFIKSLVDYIKPDQDKTEEKIEEILETIEEKVEEKIEEVLHQEIKDETSSEELPIEESQTEESKEEVFVEESQEKIEEENTDPSPNFVGGYYGDVLIDGNGPSVQTEESPDLPISSKKGVPQIDSASKVFISPTKL